MRNRIPKVVFSALVIFVGGQLFSEIWLYGGNTLAENGRWTSGKTKPEMPVMAAHFFTLSRNALARNVLHLDAWHGYQEIYTNASFKAQSVEFDFMLKPNAWFAFEYDRGSSGYRGFQLSVHPNYPSQSFRSNAEGLFEKNLPIDVKLIPNQIYHAKVAYSQTGPSLYLNGKRVSGLLGNQGLFGGIGFRQGAEPTEIDNVKVMDSKRRVLFHEDFSNSNNRFRVWLTAGLLFSLFTSFLAKRIQRRDSIGSFKASTISASYLIFFGTLFYLFDFHVWSGQYEYLEQSIRFSTNRVSVGSIFEAGRHFIFNGTFQRKRPNLVWYQFVAAGESFPNGFLTHSREEQSPDFAKLKNETRIVFVGASQTWGSGAIKLQQTFPNLIHDFLKDRLGKERTLTTWNLSLPGLTFSEQIDQLFARERTLKPDLIILNVGYTASRSTGFSEQMARIYELTKQKGYQLALLLEAMPADDSFKQSIPIPSIVDRFRLEYGTPVLNLRAHFLSEPLRKSGFLWWDQIHMSAAGNVAAARYLAPLILDLIRPPQHLIPIPYANN